MTKLKKIITVLIAIVMAATCMFALAACKKTTFDNETDRLVLSIGELDGVFNPFFSTSATDGSIIGMTQIGMLSSDKDGNVAYGENESCVVLDYGQETTGNTVNPTVDNSYTTYTFVLKNDLKFSNGSPLTMKDVLFNLYVYLDPAYTGSATVYSSEIDGLAEYRTQQKDESQQEGAQERFEREGWDRVQRLYSVISDLFEDEFKDLNVATDEKMEAALQDQVDYYTELAKDNPQTYNGYLTLLEDYRRAKELFRKELESDYTLAVGTAEDIKFNHDQVQLNTDTEAFLYNEGYLSWDDTNKKFNYTFGEDSRRWTRDQAINAVYNANIPGNTTTGILQVITMWQTANNLISEFTAKAMQDYFNAMDESDRIYNVKGIEFANRKAPVTFKNVNGETKTYEIPQYNADGSVKEGSNEVLQIRIKGIDPKAIWNFGFTVAPMYYYSNQEQIDLFDYEQHFGVSMGDIDFMNDVVNSNEKIGVPVGAGPYKATTATGSGTVTSDTFRQNNVVHYERNEYFEFPVNIKYVNYQVVDAKMMLESLHNGDIHFAEPNCQQENIDTVNSYGKGYEHDEIMTNGYGYIGINAEKVPDIAVRKAIMHAIDASLCTAYYSGYSYAIYRPMTRASWAYPAETDENGQYYAYDSTGALSQKELDESDHTYSRGSDGVLTDGNHKLKYTFTIAGDSEDHPAYNAMHNAAEILNKLGFDITVQKDINALKKLNTGDLTVWAAAWGSGVDPDMYQVYHIDSQASSTYNWGYRAIRLNATGEYTEELEIVTELSRQIDEARQTLNQATRKSIYANCLDLVMDLAVEFPTYQRSDMFVWNSNVIDTSTLTPESDRTSFNGPLSRLWEVSFVGNEVNK